MSGVILLTGASSFTGLWIAEALAAVGFQVIAPLKRARADYVGVRLERVARLEKVAEVAFDRPMGSTGLSDLIRAQPRIDALAAHGAHITGYRDPAFDAVAAFDRNMAGMLGTFQEVAQRGARAVLATGTVFEAGEGGSPDAPLAVTPYGLSKSLTSLAYRHYADWTGLRFGRLVVPSPYGVLEERRFSWHLFSHWFAGQIPAVNTPRYVRDHIPAPMLAAAYADYLCRLLADAAAPEVCRPSGWIATQGAFGERVAAEAASRLGRPCPLVMGKQIDLEEPLVRVNDQPCTLQTWDDAGFWDDYVGWYETLNRSGALALSGSPLRRSP